MTEQQWTNLAKQNLVGKTITNVWYDELFEGSYKGLVIELDGKDQIFPMRDDEGNDAGSFATSFKDLPIIPVMR